MPPAFVLSQDQTLKFNPGPPAPNRTLNRRPSQAAGPIVRASKTFASMRELQSSPTNIMPASLQTSRRLGRRPRIPSLSSQSQTTPVPKPTPKQANAQKGQRSRTKFSGPIPASCDADQTRPTKGAALITPSQPHCQPTFLRSTQLTRPRSSAVRSDDCSLPSTNRFRAILARRVVRISTGISARGAEAGLMTTAPR